jgi:predicted nucleic acid-binding protein
MAQAVADSSSLIHLKKIGQLALLESLFEQVGSRA